MRRTSAAKINKSVKGYGHTIHKRKQKAMHMHDGTMFIL